MVHYNFYDYSKTIYTRSHDIVIITCPLHGEFTVKAYSHLTGIDCLKCSKQKLKQISNFSHIQFINSKKIENIKKDIDVISKT